MKFTAHNIRLPNGDYTIGSNVLEHKSYPLMSAIHNTVSALAKKGASVLDLGCLEGGYSVELALKGYKVVGIEARKNNYDRCIFVKNEFKKLKNLTFVNGDVKDIDESKKYDLALCCGILYHLDTPVKLLNKIGRMCSIVVIDTHYSEGDMSECGFSLSHVCENEGMRGRWFYEYGENSSAKNVEENNWASYSNHKSFWMEKSDLLRAIKEAGFDLVYEQIIFSENVPRSYNKHRGLFVGIKNRAK